MKIVWDNQESRFAAELTPGDLWRNDMEAVKSAGFKTTGPPTWQWHTAKSSVLNKLRENRPQSGLFLTELALQKYNQLNEKEQQKNELRKQFNKARTEAQKAALPKPDEYFDTELQFSCFRVKPSNKIFVSMFVRPTPPDERCINCGDPLYFYDYPDICLFCEKTS